MHRSQLSDTDSYAWHRRWETPRNKGSGSHLSGLGRRIGMGNVCRRGRCHGPGRYLVYLGKTGYLINRVDMVRWYTGRQVGHDFQKLVDPLVLHPQYTCQFTYATLCFIHSLTGSFNSPVNHTLSNFTDTGPRTSQAVITEWNIWKDMLNPSLSISAETFATSCA